MMMRKTTTTTTGRLLLPLLRPSPPRSHHTHLLPTNNILRNLSSSSPSSSSIKPKRKWTLLGGSLVITTVGGITYMYNHVGGTEGLFRSISFYSVAIPRYFQYRYFMWKNASDDEWDDLHLETSQMGLDKILDLRGFYIKSGQMAAANIGNAFPKIWQDTMSVLQDECPPKEFETVKAVIETEMGKPLERVFQSFEKTPIGAASIGQVHRATLWNGDQVVVKVMYPEVESLFRGDVRTIKMFAKLAQPVHVPALEEIEKQFMTEFDYEKEAKQMDIIRDNLIEAGLAGKDKVCRVPKPYLELCTKKVLVMEELKGDKLAVGLLKNLEQHSARMNTTPEQLEEQFQTFHNKHNQKNQQGPSAQQMDRYIEMLESKRRIENLTRAIYNIGIGWWFPGATTKKKEYEERGALLLNHARIVDELLFLHGHEVLVDGYFNGDPHPGNILLLSEGKHPQLGLIDYGQVKRLSKQDRLLMCQVVIALAEDNKYEIIRLMKEAGYKSRDMNDDVIYRYAKVYYDEDNDELTEGMHIQLFMEELQRRDPIDQLPKEFILVSRTSIMLRGLAHALHQSRSVAKAWRPIAERVLREEGLM